LGGIRRGGMGVRRWFGGLGKNVEIGGERILSAMVVLAMMEGGMSLSRIGAGLGLGLGLGLRLAGLPGYGVIGCGGLRDPCRSLADL
jgi:hypothetical protein